MSLRSTAAAATLVALALLGAAPASAAVESTTSLRITFLPQKIFRGQAASLSVAVRPLRARCSGSVVYADGRKQGLKATTATAGKVTWKWVVPHEVKQGGATVNVGCGRAGSVARAFVVAVRPTEPARVEVEKQGFSQRVRYTTREVSYGIVLANVSPENDALDVSVHVNMLDATGTIRKTEVKGIKTIGAKALHYLGGSATIPEGTPISTLELKVRIGAQQPKALKVPALSDHRIVTSSSDPGWVGGVFFQALNDQPLYVFSSPTISAVIFDAAGNVLGGGAGYGATPLAPGIRAQYSASSGFSAIPFDRAASAGVSVIGTYTRDT